MKKRNLLTFSVGNSSEHEADHSPPAVAPYRLQAAVLKHSHSNRPLFYSSAISFCAYDCVHW